MTFKKIESLLFYILVFLIPCNLGKHFVQNFSYVSGVLVDYLIPTVYLTDLLIVALFLVWIVKRARIKNQESRIKNNNLKFKIILFGLILTTNYLLLSPNVINKPTAIYKLLKLVEMAGLVFYIKHNINIKKDIKNIIKVLSFSVIWQSALAIAQWFKQGSIFGFWFFGEQPYSSATLAIKTINFFGQIKVLPMGTFPHPNVLAGFLVISLLLIYQFSPLLLFHPTSNVANAGMEQSSSQDKNILAILLGLIALGLTFSLPAWVGLGLVLLVMSKKNSRSFRLILTTSLLAFWLGYLLLISYFGFNTLDLSSLTRRWQLTQIAIKMWLSSPLMGIGLNNFINRMEEFGRVTANYRFLQPVHNVFLLVLAETGVIGIIILVLSIKYLVLRRRKSQSNHLLLTTCYLILFLGLFDHYWLTIQQGMLGVSIVLGLTLGGSKPRST